MLTNTPKQTTMTRSALLAVCAFKRARLGTANETRGTRSGLRRCQLKLLFIRRHRAEHALACGFRQLARAIKFECRYQATNRDGRVFDAADRSAHLTLAQL